MSDESNPPNPEPLALPDGTSRTVSERLRDAVALLEALQADRSLLLEVDKETSERLLVAAGRVSRPDKAARKALSKAREKINRIAERDDADATLSQTGIRKLRENPIFETPRRLAQFAAGHNGAARPLPLSHFDGPDSNPARLEPDADQADLVGLSMQAEQAEQAEQREADLADPSDAAPTATRPRKERVQCYVCREDFGEIHWFYDQLCPTCGDFNYSKRDPHVDLTGRYAVVTGSRVKIGYQAAIMLLRNGCHVIVTTRFPRDAARRFAAEVDFGDWTERLQIHGLDLRHIPSVEAFCARLLNTLPRLDFIINNACQTVRRPPGFYDHLMGLERRIAHEHNPAELALLAEPDASFADNSESAALALTANRLSGALATSPIPTHLSAELSQIPLVASDLERGEHLFPTGALDADQQQVDLREMNSWRLKLADVETVELVEVHVVNAVAPFIINARLKPLMQRVPTADKHIVNVSAMEGQFYRSYKSDRHPHTNMAKASLNMMTRTAALDYIESGIHMNSVDTGWVTDEDPAAIAQRKREEHRFHPPLDIVDGAARIVDPIFDGLSTGRHIWGQFLKDYRITDW
jgi:NAD(P)-dependent dehydrogenase (short-subunit alcohol dehydrogenase family)